MGTVATNSSETSSTSDNELSQLVGELTGDITGPDGKLDTGTPLGKMLDDFVKNNLPDGLASQGDPAQSMTKKGVSQALTSMIQDVLGGGSNSNSSDSGQGDLKSLILGALGKSKLDSLLTPNPGRDGSNFSTSGVDPQILAQVGKFMDDNPDEFAPPDQGASEGQVGGWTGELNANVAGDNFLNHDENAAVTKALGMLGQIMQQGLASPEASSSGQNSLPTGNVSSSSAGGQEGGASYFPVFGNQGNQGNQASQGSQGSQSALGQQMQEMQAMQQMEQAFEQFEQAAQGAGASQGSSNSGGTSSFDQLMSLLNQGGNSTHGSHHSSPLQASAQDTSSKILNNLFG
ncbi:hypothetical protein BFW87_24080 [Pseudomonas fluorescens]|uniref:Uncharacterized protein n=2 Tax=Pseudomonas fluorescens TaxID=294 RepID=A0A1T2Y6A0_PSEFL|nr:hypothetical protein BFW87_24080 [Pseudomonas fluorescens]